MTERTIVHRNLPEYKRPFTTGSIVLRKTLRTAVTTPPLDHLVPLD